VSRILIIEDNVDLAFGLQRTLEFEGHQVEVCGDGEQGIERATSLEPELILLDVLLPGADGFAVLRRMRQAGLDTPVLMLTARGEESDVVLGFDSGADDYVTKPFSTAELLARVRALLRRAAAPVGNGAAIERFGNVEVNVGARTVSRAGEPVSLTPREFDLLIALLRRGGAVAARSDLLREVWQWENTDITTRTVDIHVAELRRKLEDDPANPRYILTARKAGYSIRQTGS
jgi:two-component system alkaline phosphatase synthesis response regulator PhoP